MSSFYFSYVLQNALGVERNLSLIVGGCIGLCIFYSNIHPLLSTDEWGSRVPLMLGAAGQAIATLIIAITVKLSLSGNKKAGVTAIVFVMVCIAVYSGFGWVAGPWLYPTDLGASTLLTVAAYVAWKFGLPS